MIDKQVHKVLDLLNSELHGRVDYTLFSKIFDTVALIDIPENHKLVPNELSAEVIRNLDNRFTEIVLKDNDDYQELYKVMIGAVE